MLLCSYLSTASSNNSYIALYLNVDVLDDKLFSVLLFLLALHLPPSVATLPLGEDVEMAAHIITSGERELGDWSFHFFHEDGIYGIVDFWGAFPEDFIVGSKTHVLASFLEAFKIASQHCFFHDSSCVGLRFEGEHCFCIVTRFLLPETITIFCKLEYTIEAVDVAEFIL